MAKSVILFFGTDEYLVARHAKACVKKLCPDGNNDLALEIIDGKASNAEEACLAIDKCIASYKTAGLFGEAKCIWLRDVNFLNNSIILKNQKVQTMVDAVTSDIQEGLPEGHSLVISAEKIDRRKGLFKALKKVAEIHEYDLPERDYEVRPIAVRRVIEYTKKHGLHFAPNAAEILVDKVGFDTRQIISELEKLVLYKDQEKTITIEDVDLMISPTGEAIIWDFTDAVAEGKLEKAVNMFRKLVFQKENPIRLIIALEGLFHDLLRFREYLDIGWASLVNKRIQWSKDAEMESYFSALSNDPRKMHWFRSTKLASQSSKYSASQLDACRRLTLEIHEKMVSSGSISHELMMEILLARVCLITSNTKAA